MEKKESSFSQAVIYSVLGYINELSPFAITVEELQKMSGYSKRHLTRLFLKHTEVRPSEYIRLMQMYRIFLELKFTTSTYIDLCNKYNIKDIPNFRAKFKKITGLDIAEIKATNTLNFNDPLTRIKICKDYLSCSFVSLFDYNFSTKGKIYKFARPIDKIMTSHFDLVEQTANAFCSDFSFEREAIWTCVRFEPADELNYIVIIFPCLVNSSCGIPDSTSLSLQGDYLRFTWVGKLQDTFPKVKNIYDLFFITYGAVRREGFDIIHRKKMDGVRGFYVFSYHIPVVLNESILSALNN
ncbi:helix-turn-helix domain-containing protein [Enterobacter sp. 120016]|uniref:helix-turn-helix domain-containing protein n=1 Tax=Enterobacter sp. 120016 TaxID=2834878 RepID=UPI001BCC1EBC|nr:helix-turn-helix domain-containing protein [Enterobacter sp. 120016]MBS7440985.1 helix-turn-helix domain-containing protein [Enterobacter sp. 120016]